MTGIIGTLERTIGKLGNVASVIACIFCSAMALHIAAEAVARTAFDMPLPGTVAIVSHYYMIAITFLPLALIERRDANVSVEIVVQHLSATMQRVIEFLGWVLTAFAFGLLTWVTWIEAVRRYEVGTYVMESGRAIILWPTYFMPAIGFGLATLVLAARILALLLKANEPASPSGNGTTA